MSSELISLNSAVTTDRPVGYGTSPTLVQPNKKAPLPGTTKPEVALKNTATTKQQIKEIKEEEKATTEEKTDSLLVDELKEALDDINSALYSYNRSLRFELHEETDDLVVKVFNTKTDEVIRQYPSEEVLERKARLLEGDINFFSTQVS